MIAIVLVDRGVLAVGFALLLKKISP